MTDCYSNQIANGCCDDSKQPTNNNLSIGNNNHHKKKCLFYQSSRFPILIDTQSGSIKQFDRSKTNREPEGVCVQEVHVVVCSLPEDVQQEVHTQFDSKPEEYSYPMRIHT